RQPDHHQLGTRLGDQTGDGIERARGRLAPEHAMRRGEELGFVADRDADALLADIQRQHDHARQLLSRSSLVPLPPAHADTHFSAEPLYGSLLNVASAAGLLCRWQAGARYNRATMAYPEVLASRCTP